MSKPKLFTYTAYRLPNKEDLIDIDNCKLTSDEIIEGFGYTIVGRGMLGNKQKKDITKSIQMLADMFPTNKEYKKALEAVKQKYDLKESKMALPIKNTNPNNLSLKELIATDLPAPIQTETKGDGFIALPSSSCQAAKYDDATETLYIRFNTGVYEYFDVPEEIFQQLLKAKSIGSFFYHNIRKIYNYTLSKKYKMKGAKRTVKENYTGGAGPTTEQTIQWNKKLALAYMKESRDASNDGFNWSEEHRIHLESILCDLNHNTIRDVLTVLDNEYGIDLDFDEATLGIVNIDTWNKVFPTIGEDEWEELFDRLSLVTDDSNTNEEPKWDGESDETNYLAEDFGNDIATDLESDDELKYEGIIISLGQMIDDQVYQLYMKYKGNKEELYPYIDAVQVLMDNLDDEVAIEASPEFAELCQALGQENTLTEAVDPDITDEQETFYFTSSSKDILGVKGLEHPTAQGLAIEILSKFRKEFQSALDKANISQSFIMTLEFKDKEEMPNNTEEESEELSNDNPLKEEVYKGTVDQFKGTTIEIVKYTTPVSDSRAHLGKVRYIKNPEQLKKLLTIQFDNLEGDDYFYDKYGNFYEPDELKGIIVKLSNNEEVLVGNLTPKKGQTLREAKDLFPKSIPGVGEELYKQLKALIRWDDSVNIPESTKKKEIELLGKTASAALTAKGILDNEGQVNPINNKMDLETKSAIKWLTQHIS